MKMGLPCLPCSLRQALEAAQNATDDKNIQAAIVEDCLKLIANYKAYASSPELARDMHKVVYEYTGISDPYAEAKLSAINDAERELATVKGFIERKGDLYSALKAAVTGNNIDLSAYSAVDVAKVIENELEIPFAVCDLEIFAEKLKHAKTLLIIGDNAGESVFDRVFIEALPPLDVTYAVKSAPIVNDVTELDAINSGLHNVAKIITTGSNVPGVLLSEASPEFADAFRTADIVISKGQGNFETLDACGRDIFFLLKAKCPMNAEAFGVPLGSYIFKYFKG